MRIFIILSLLMSSSLAQNYNVTPHKELQGLQFIEHGSLKLITQLHAIKFNITLTELEQSLTIIKADVINAKKLDPNDANFMKKLSEVEKFVELKMLEYMDITGGFEPFEAPKQENHREKRHIKEGLEVMRQYINNLTVNIYNFEKAFNETSKIMNDTALTIEKDNKIHEFQRRAGNIEARFDAIIGVQIQERLSSYLVSFDDFKVEKDKIERSLGVDEELPYDSLNEYYHNLKVSHEIVNRNLILSIDIPIVQKAKWNLYKIQEFPARFNDSMLIITSVGWKFLANSSNEYTKLTSLKPCITSGSSYLCEPQASIQTTSDDDCLTHAFIKRMINPQMCHTVEESFDELTFMQLSNARYFYFAPTDENISITCEGKKHRQELSKSGVISLGPGCSMITSTYKLLPTQFIKSIPVENILQTGFNLEELDKVMAGEKSSLTKNPFYENVESLKFNGNFYEYSILEFNKHYVRAGWNDWHVYIVGALVLLLVVGLIIKCCCCRFCC